ncbi:rhamnan synthesis F family protein [Enterococcus rivorum]|uniref:Glycosyl transferase n=1 Tax=Enterococcus rivorum TaxID=762845 RepID=A0A1E5KW06_9ENTE|nr:rhamnan synthesis F family protein [Enterococcus rivorum]MBP2098408.1 glycosyltransferase involved in cell wall biosynthesis [Enterococcus rivorum]OEH81809.1 glycosyl transferase [Enterococcus rivorum]
MKELVSVVITCYNHETYIEQCLNSVFSQTYNNIELLIINDGSTDSSDKVILGLLPNSPFENTEYISQKNTGICISRNKGLDWVSGEFILFVDSDNYLDNDYVEKLVLLAKSRNSDIIYTNLYNVDKQEIFMEAKEFELESYLSANYIDNCSLIRTSKIRHAKYDLELNRKKLVDYDFIMNLILNNGAQPSKCHGTKLNYRVLENSISRKANHSSDKYYFEIYLYILSKYIDKYPQKIMRAIGNNITGILDRLVDLISHLEDLTSHIHNQEHELKKLYNKMEELNAEVAIGRTLEEKVRFENKNLMSENKNLISENKNLISENKNLISDNLDLNNIVSILKLEKEQILSSKSFRLGNFIIKPISYGERILKNPKLLIKVVHKLKRFLAVKVQQLPTPKTLFLKCKRNMRRKKNNYQNPKRYLIFVIYENQENLHKYKLYFLKALAEIVDDVLIVVNGFLPESDIIELSKLGHVESRDNVGYDTAAFRYGIKYLGKDILSKYDELLLVNDTNVGPIGEFSTVFSKMSEKELDFWGISYGEAQNDFTQYNKYGFIPIHLQSYFLVIEKSLLTYPGFYEYWENLSDTNSRNKAIGKHETVFTKYFEELGFKHGALTDVNTDSPMYIHPLMMVNEGVPLVKYTAFSNYNSDKFAWQGLHRESEIPELVEYIRNETDYPIEIIEKIMIETKETKHKEHILIIDGVENVIPQLTQYRIQNKIEQLESLGYDVWSVNLSSFQMGYAEHASHIIIYRAPLDNRLVDLIRLARKYNKVILYDIDDLVIDTKYTNQLTYVQNLSNSEKKNYDIGVISYGEMLKQCDGVITSTKKMKDELHNYKGLVLLNRNLANMQLVELSQKVMRNYEKQSGTIKIGYFSGSITHNENFELIKESIKKLLRKYDNLELHLVGHLDIPDDMNDFKQRIKVHSFVHWELLPDLVSQVDINLAPLVTSIFNEAKSEIKWIEAALVKVPTVASNIGAFKEMIIENETGILADDSEWYEKLERLIKSYDMRKYIAENAYKYVLENATTLKHDDELTDFLSNSI